MRKVKLIIFVISTIILFVSCDKLFDDDSKADANTMGGDTNISMATPGNTFSAPTVYVAGQSYSIPHTITVTKNENGIATMNVKVNISNIKNSPEYAQYNSKFNLDELISKIPANYKDASGNIDANVQFKITSEGIQDFINKDGKAHTIVKYNSNVGDQYNLKKSSGKTLERTVTQKSTTDDFPYGFYYIKTITVEQKSNYPGIEKIVYKANHKFGLVYAEIVMEDGSKVSSYLYSAN
jgi:hypothetical protein